MFLTNVMLVIFNLYSCTHYLFLILIIKICWRLLVNKCNTIMELAQTLLILVAQVPNSEPGSIKVSLVCRQVHHWKWDWDWSINNFMLFKKLLGFVFWWMYFTVKTVTMTVPVYCFCYWVQYFVEHCYCFHSNTILILSILVKTLLEK